MKNRLLPLAITFIVTATIFAHTSWQYWREGNLKNAAVFAGAIVLDVISFGFLVWLQKKTEARRAYFLTNGQVIQAKVLEIRKNTYGRSDLPMTIIARATNPLTGQEQTFEGGSGYQDPTPYLRVGEAVTVYVDPRNPEKYLMDTSFLPEKNIFSA